MIITLRCRRITLQLLHRTFTEVDTFINNYPLLSKPIRNTTPC